MAVKSSAQKNDFSRGPVWKCIITQAVPLTIAQLILIKQGGFWAIHLRSY